MAVNERLWEVFNNFDSKVYTALDPSQRQEWNDLSVDRAELFNNWADSFRAGEVGHSNAMIEYFEILEMFGYDYSEFDWEEFREAYGTE